MLPLVLIGLVALASSVATGIGVAVNNWTSQPTTIVNQPEDDVFTNTSSSGSAISINQTTLLVIGGLAVILLLNKK